MSTTADSAETFAFGPFVLDTHRGTLTRSGEALFLRPKAYALLQHLARNLGRVVPKAELMDAVWPGVYVTEDSLTQSVREIRKAIGDAEQTILRTMSRRGYMLTGAVVHEPEADAAGTQPMVAVLRFRNDSGDAARDPIVDGFAEDIITGLARYGSFTVLARNSSFQFASDQPGSRTLAAERIGADYLVEGSVRWSGSAALVSVSLIDAKHVHQLWGERYEADDIQLFSVQREIGENIVNRIALRLDDDSIRRMASRPAASLAAYELTAMGIAAIRGYGMRRPADAIPLLERAIEQDAQHGVAYGWLALAKIQLANYGEASRAVLEEAQALASRAMVLSPDHANGARIRSLARTYLREYGGAERDMRLSLDLNRYYAESIEQFGYLLTLRGRATEALELIDRAIRLNPIYPEYYHYDRGLALYGLGEYADAAEALERPAFRPPLMELRLAAAYAQAGNADAAARSARKALADDPGFDGAAHSRRHMAFEHQADAEHLAEGMERALAYAR